MYVTIKMKYQAIRNRKEKQLKLQTPLPTV